MIKIIQRGTRQKRECEQCGCLFTYEDEDAKYDATKKEYFVVCPQCGASLTVNKAKAKEWKPETLSSAEEDEMRILLANGTAISEGSRASQRLQELMWRNAKAQEAKNEADSD